MSSTAESDSGDEATMPPRWCPYFSNTISTYVQDTPMTSDERRERQIEAHRLIKEKYDAGVPLFTKDLLRDIARQLEDSGTEAVSVTGLNGVAVQFPLKTADQDEYRYPLGPDHFYIRSTPQLHYQKIQDLLATKDPEEYMDKYAYLPVEIQYGAEVRNVHTNEIVHFLPVCDYDTVSRAFEQTKQTLQDSEQFAQFKATLASAAVPSGINKIVAFACGMMTGEADAHRTVHSMGQHSLVLTIRDFLASRDGTAANRGSRSEIRCYAQDPMYKAIDKQILREVGITVVDDPGGFLEVDEASVVVCAYPDIPVRQVVADIARPALIIWNKLADQDGGVGSTDSQSPRVRQMLEEYTELPFQLDDASGFGDGLAMYVRKDR